VRDWLATASFVTDSNRPAEKVAKDAERLQTGGDFLLRGFVAMIDGLEFSGQTGLELC
jgi:hypothetical protein